MQAKLRAAQLQMERDEHMLSIRKLQATNRVLRGSGKELLALASPSLSPPGRAGAAASPPTEQFRPWSAYQVSVPYANASPVACADRSDVDLRV